MNLDGQIYVFGRFRVDVRKRLLMSGNEIVMLPPKAFDTLLSLIENNGSVPVSYTHLTLPTIYSV